MMYRTKTKAINITYESDENGDFLKLTQHIYSWSTEKGNNIIAGLILR